VGDESPKNIISALDTVPQQMGRVHYGKKRSHHQKRKPDSNSGEKLNVRKTFEFHDSHVNL
jgi:hypothetical protein